MHRAQHKSTKVFGPTLVLLNGGDQSLPLGWLTYRANVVH